MFSSALLRKSIALSSSIMNGEFENKVATFIEHKHFRYEIGQKLAAAFENRANSPLGDSEGPYSYSAAESANARVQ